MRKRHRHFIAVVTGAMALGLMLPAGSLADKPKGKPRPDGRATGDGALRVLHLSGGPHDRGLAHGRKFGNEIIKLLNAFVKTERLSGGPQGYEQNVSRIGLLMTFGQAYRDEMQGIYDGVRESSGGNMEIKSLGRNLTPEDIIAMNCIADSAGFGCSSFATWGPMTKTGDTIVARNLDWFYIPEMAANQILVVQAPDSDSGRAGWVGVTWPGAIGCYTGMNEYGVTVSMHDVYAGAPDQPMGFTPRSLILREAIEKARPATAERDIMTVLKAHSVAVGNNIPVGVPYVEGTDAPPFMVFEYDGRRGIDGGVVVRRTEMLNGGGSAKSNKRMADDRCFDVCTNHYRKRLPAERCTRYQKLNDSLTDRSKAGKPLDAAEAGRILGLASVAPAGKTGGLLTYHSVIFEPNRRTLRVAICRGQRLATDSDWTSFSIERLLKEGN
ncbi:MAG: hypothetical protein KF841_02395 [Phycisphaerae bacterium]|nr:hypothetical protein [Phycisphaerae bacterium]